MMKKIQLFILTIILTPIIAGVYGIFHNQFTFTLSEEFFTKFMFERFGFVEYGTETPRLTASIIGIWSTWWFGLIIGFIFAAVGFNQPNSKLMFQSICKAITITFATTILIGILGFFYGKSGLSSLSSTCCFPLQIKNTENFIAVSEAHNFSYFGGITGTIIGVIYQLRIGKSSA